MMWNEINPKDQDPPLPPDHLPVLVRMVDTRDGAEQFSVQQYADSEQCFSGEVYSGEGWKVTHWMYIPTLLNHE